jgi:hypothetical protein
MGIAYELAINISNSHEFDVFGANTASLLLNLDDAQSLNLY